jgi:hypothetical protein
MDLGGSAWNGRINWLEIDVETNGASPFTVLTPRQQLTPASYAIFANGASNLVGTLPVGQLSGMVGNGQLANNSVTVNAGTGLSGGGTALLGGSTTLNNAGVTSLAGSQGVTVSAAIGPVTLGSTATSANTFGAIVSRNGTGTFAAQSIILAGSLLLPASPAIIDAGSNPFVYSDSVSNTFVGLNAGGSGTTGPQNTAIGAQALFSNTTGYNNVANGTYALRNNIGGSNNVADGYEALYDNTVSGNTAEGYQALYANVNGQFNAGVGYEALQANVSGTHNTAVGYLALFGSTNSVANTAVGVETLAFTTGSGNTAVGANACINDSSGFGNTGIGYQALWNNQTGSNNIALGYLAGSGISIGSSNIDIGNDGTGIDNNIIRIGTTQTATYLVGTVYANGVALTSDRNAKENFAAIDPQKVLAKVASMPVSEWNYKSDRTMQHIGPMAQDFQAAFGLNGQDDKHISVVDEGGVTLAAIQGLNQKVDELRKELDQRDAENGELQRQNDALSERLSQLEAAVNRLSAQK